MELPTIPLVGLLVVDAPRISPPSTASASCGACASKTPPAARQRESSAATVAAIPTGPASPKGATKTRPAPKGAFATTCRYAPQETAPSKTIPDAASKHQISGQPQFQAIVLSSPRAAEKNGTLLTTASLTPVDRRVHGSTETCAKTTNLTLYRHFLLLVRSQRWYALISVYPLAGRVVGREEGGQLVAEARR